MPRATLNYYYSLKGLAELTHLGLDSNLNQVISFAGWLPQGAQLEVFSSWTGGWTERSVHWGVDSDAMTATLRYFVGTLYVLAYPHHIVAIDLEDDKKPSRLIGLPAPVMAGACIDRCGGRLHYACEEGGHIKVWVAEEGGGGWALRYSVDTGAIVRRLMVKLRQVHLLGHAPGEGWGVVPADAGEDRGLRHGEE